MPPIRLCRASQDPHLGLGVSQGQDRRESGAGGTHGTPALPWGHREGDGLCFIPGAWGLQGGGRRPPRRTPQRREETRALSRRWLRPWLGRGLWPQISWRDHHGGAVLGFAFATEGGRAGRRCGFLLTHPAGHEGRGGIRPQSPLPAQWRGRSLGFCPLGVQLCPAPAFLCMCGASIGGLGGQLLKSSLPQTAPLSAATAGWGAPRERTAFQGKKM